MSDKENIIYPSSHYEVPIGLKYLRLPEAILEITEAVFLLAAVIAVAATPDKVDEEDFYGHFIMSSAIFLAVTVVIIALYVTGLVRKINIPWSMLELFYCAAAAIVIMTMGAHVAANTYDKVGLVLGVIFGYIAMVAYFIEMIFAIRAWKRSIIGNTLRKVEQGRMDQFTYTPKEGTSNGI